MEAERRNMVTDRRIVSNISQRTTTETPTEKHVNNGKNETRNENNERSPPPYSSIK
jgi:hypothetical protein